MPLPDLAVVTGAFSYTGNYVTGIYLTKASGSGH